LGKFVTAIVDFDDLVGFGVAQMAKNPLVTRGSRSRPPKILVSYSAFREVEAFRGLCSYV
jgi:hypothetical protein